MIKNKASKVFARAKDRPYTYISKKDNKTKNLRSNMRTKHMESGNKKLRYAAKVKFTVSVLEKITIPEKVYETSRLLFLTKINKAFPKIEKADYLFRFVKYPHQILRLKTSVSAQKGISVDRISSGMKNAFGKPYSLAARITKPNEALIEFYLSEKYNKESSLQTVRKIFREINHKLPCNTKVVYQILDKPTLSQIKEL